MLLHYGLLPFSFSLFTAGRQHLEPKYRLYYDVLTDTLYFASKTNIGAKGRYQGSKKPLIYQDVFDNAAGFCAEWFMSPAKAA